jgi:hypothetical protein
MTESRRASGLVFGYVYPFVFVVALNLAARGETIFGPLYSIDTYGQGFQSSVDPVLYDLVLSQGRYGVVPLYWLRELLGYMGAGVAVSALMLAVLLFAHSGLLFAQVILRRPTTVEMTLFLALFTLHPFITEFFHFTDATVVIALAIWLASLGLYVATRVSRTLPAIVGGIVLIAAALSIYQTAISFVVTVCLLALVVRLGRVESADSEAFFRSRQARAFIAALVSVPVYLVSVRVVALVSGVPSGGPTQLPGLADPVDLLRVIVGFVRMALLPWPVIITRSASIVLVALLALSVLAVVWAAYRQRRLLGSVACAGVFAMALVWSVGAPALSTSWLVPRVLVGISIFTASTILLGWRSAQAPFIRRPDLARGLLGVGVILLSIAYIGASNRILADQRRLNQWDAQKANRIVARWESQPGFRGDMPVVVVGGGLPYPSISTAIGDMNYSALYVPWAKNGLFEQATGYRFGRPTEEEQSLAHEYCESADPWPAVGSAVLLGNIAVVCLPS